MVVKSEVETWERFINSEIIKKYPLLKREEIVVLAKRKDAGNRDALERMVLHNAMLVLRYVSHCGAPRFLWPDLAHEGFRGLMKAAEKYDWRKGWCFSTYAMYWIKQSVKRGMMDSNWIRIPYYQMAKMNKFYKKRGNGQKKMLKNTYFMAALAAAKVKFPSLDAIVDSDSENPGTISDFLKDKRPSHELAVNARYDIELLFSCLSKREKGIVVRRYGLFGRKPQTLKAIGKIYHITKERVRQIEYTAVKKMQSYSRSEAKDNGNGRTAKYLSKS